MTTQAAKKIALFDLLNSLGHQPIRFSIAGDGSKMALFYSPFREERTASFWLNVDKNIFNDFGGKSGNILDFVMEYAQTDLRGALGWLSDRVRERPLKRVEQGAKSRKASPAFTLVSVKALHYYPIKNYVESRGIPLGLAEQYLKEVDYRGRDGKTFKGIGTANEAGGYEIRSFGGDKFHTSLVAKEVSFFKGRGEQLANVFESSFDFLSFLVLAKLQEPDGDSYVLHTTSHAKPVALRLQAQTKYKKIRLWLDNDEAGQQASDLYAELLGSRVRDMRYKYQGFKDLNAFLINSPK